MKPLEASIVFRLLQCPTLHFSQIILHKYGSSIHFGLFWHGVYLIGYITFQISIYSLYQNVLKFNSIAPIRSKYNKAAMRNPE